MPPAPHWPPSRKDLAVAAAKQAAAEEAANRAMAALLQVVDDVLTFCLIAPASTQSMRGRIQPQTILITDLVIAAMNIE